jgi:hypothetical protein
MEEEVVVDQQEEATAPCISYKSVAVSRPRLILATAMALLGIWVSMLVVFFPALPTAVKNWLIFVAIVLFSPVLMIFYQFYMMILPRFYTLPTQPPEPEAAQL